MKKRYYILIVVFLVGFLFSSCDSSHKFSTIGKEYDLLLFADNKFYNPRKEMIRENLSDSVYFTRSESKFRVMKKNIEKASRMKKYKNIVFIDDIMNTDDVTKYVTDVLGRDKVYETDNITIAHKKNVWAKGQTVVFVLIAGEESFTESRIEEAIAEAGQVIEENVQKRIKEEVFKESENKKLVKKAKENVDIEPYIPERYFSFKEKKNFLSVVTRAPDRLFFFYREEFSVGQQIKEDKAVELRNRATKKYYDGDVVFTEMKEWKKENPDKNYFYDFKEIEYKGDKIYKLQGLWENNKNYRGGAFVTYFYKDKEGEYVYLFDAMLHNPGENKWPYINKMDMIQRRNAEMMIDKSSQTEE